MQVGELTVRLDIDMTEFSSKMDSAFAKLNEITLKMADAVNDTIRNRVAVLSGMSQKVRDIGIEIETNLKRMDQALYFRAAAGQIGSSIRSSVSNAAAGSGYSYYYDAGTVQTFSPTIQVSGGINSLEYRKEVNRLMRQQAALIAR